MFLTHNATVFVVKDGQKLLEGQSNKGNSIPLFESHKSIERKQIRVTN